MRPRLQRLLDALLRSPDGQPGLRRAAAARAAELGGGALASADALPAELEPWIQRVAREAWEATDDDVARLRSAGYSEDAIFEVTVAAAVGAAVARYQAGMRALAAAPPSGPK